MFFATKVSEHVIKFSLRGTGIRFYGMGMCPYGIEICLYGMGTCLFTLCGGGLAPGNAECRVC